MNAATLLPLVLGASAASLIGTPHCLGMCGGFAVACGQRASHRVAWSAGRLTTYALLGALAGSGALVVPGPSWVLTALSAVLLMLWSLSLAGWLEPLTPKLPGLTRLGGRLLRRRGLLGRYGFGLVNGLLPCGLVYSTLGVALAAGGPLGGALVMLGFGLGTLPGLVAASAGFTALVRKHPLGRKAMAALVLVLGLLALGLRSRIG